MPTRTLGPEEENECHWPRRGMDCEIPRRLGGEQNILYKGVEISSSRRVLKTEEKSERKSSKMIYLLVVDLGCYTSHTQIICS